MSVVVNVLIEAKTGWKKEVNKKISGLDTSRLLQPIEIQKCALKYPGWKVVSFLYGQKDDGEAKDFVLSLVELGLENVYFFNKDEDLGLNIECHINNKLEFYNSVEAAENAFFDVIFDKNIKYFSDEYEYENKLLVRIKPKNKTTYSKLKGLLEAVITSADDQDWLDLAEYFDKELNAYSEKQDLDIVWAFPGSYIAGFEGSYKADERLLRNLVYLYDDGKYLYLGFHHPKLESYVNNNYNFGGGGGQSMLSIIKALGYVSTTISAKARLKRFADKNIEGYFFGSKEALYYREQVRIPEAIWGETPDA